jgi:hypothetical protein
MRAVCIAASLACKRWISASVNYMAARLPFTSERIGIKIFAVNCNLCHRYCLPFKEKSAANTASRIAMQILGWQDLPARQFFNKISMSQSIKLRQNAALSLQYI